MEQISFLQQMLEQQEKKSKKGWEELMKKGLKENRMGAVDREEFLLEQIEKMKESKDA